MNLDATTSLSNPNDHPLKGQFDQIIFSGGGTRCAWHGGFIEAVRKPLALAPKRIAGVSGGALSAAGFIGEHGRELLSIMGDGMDRVDDNLDLEGDEPGGWTPHQAVYCQVVRNTITPETIEKVANGPEFQVLLSHPPSTDKPKWSTLPLLFTYQADLLFRSTPFMKWPEQMGLTTELIDARQAAADGKLVDLICNAAVIPPVFNIQEWAGKNVADGGLGCKAPIPEPDEGRTLILLTRRFRNLPSDPRRIFVQVSRETPADKLDFSDRQSMEKTWEMGYHDGLRFLEAYSHPLRAAQFGVVTPGNAMTPYEARQLEAIEQWRNAEPDIVARTADKVLSSMTSGFSRFIPAGAMKRALDLGEVTGHTLSRFQTIKERAGIIQYAELKKRDLETCDNLAQTEQKWAVGTAAVEGGVTGALGLPGMLLDVPAIVAFALRSVHLIGLCYGYELRSDREKAAALAILAVSGANSMKQKLAALAALDEHRAELVGNESAAAETAVENVVAHQGTLLAAKNLPKQLWMNLTRRKLGQAVPFIGMGIGATVNGWYIKDVCMAARRVFQERWLTEKGIVIPDSASNATREV